MGVNTGSERRIFQEDGERGRFFEVRREGTSQENGGGKYDLVREADLIEGGGSNGIGSARKGFQEGKRGSGRDGG